MNRDQVNRIFREQLSHLEEREINQLVRIYMEDVSSVKEARIRADALKLKEQVPIQYVTEQEVFLDHKFKVTPAVLIPRPETEELVAWVFEDFKGSNKSLNCLDVGTGSGIIPISLKLNFPNWNVLAIDISNEALDVAKENAVVLNADVKFAQADFLNREERDFGSVDVLISNPPYIPFAEAEKMGESVLKHEPHIALFVKSTLIFYEAICEFSKINMKPTACVYVELNEYQAEETLSLFQKYFSDVILKEDMQGKKRMLRARHQLS